MHLTHRENPEESFAGLVVLEHASLLEELEVGGIRLLWRARCFTSSHPLIEKARHLKRRASTLNEKR